MEQWCPLSCPCDLCGIWCGSAGILGQVVVWTCSTAVWCTPHSWWGSGKVSEWTHAPCGRYNWTSLLSAAAPLETLALFCSRLRWHKESKSKDDLIAENTQKTVLKPNCVVLRPTWNILGISLASARYTSVWVTGLTWKSLLCGGNKAINCHHSGPKHEIILTLPSFCRGLDLTSFVYTHSISSTM